MPTENEEIKKEDVKKPGFNPTDFLDKATLPTNKDESSDDDSTPDPKDQQPNKPTPKTKEDNIKALKQQKEAAEKQAEELRKENEKLQKLKRLEKISDYIKQKKGKEDIDDEDVEEYITRNKTRKQDLEKISKDHQEKDLALREYSIEHSEEWKSYKKNIEKSSDILKTTIINVDGTTGAVRAPNATKKFIQAIVSLKEDGDSKRPLLPLEIKTELAKFKKEYEEESGLDYDAPSLNELVKATEEFHKHVGDSVKARSNWNKTIEENRKAKLYEESKRREQEIKQEIQGRDFLVSKLKDEDDIKQLRGYVGDSIDAYIKEEHQFMTDAYSGKDVQLRGYGSMIATMAKAKAVPALLAKIKELEASHEKLRNDIDSESARSPGSRSSQRKVETNEEEEIKLKPGDDYDPAGFLSGR